MDAEGLSGIHERDELIEAINRTSAERLKLIKALKQTLRHVLMLTQDALDRENTHD